MITIEGLAYVPESPKVYTSNWHERAIGVVDLARMAVVKRLSALEKPDGIAYAAPFHKAYVSDERGKAEIIVDAREDRIVKTLRFDSETGVPQYDPIARKVYVNLQDDNVLAVLDLETRRVTARLPMAKGADVVQYDPGLRRVYVACASGFISVFAIDGAAHARKIEDVPVERKVHSLAVDVETHRVYAPEEEEQGRPVARIVVFRSDRE
jgi:DNA-binding beta-propeller fold protein YncE